MSIVNKLLVPLRRFAKAERGNVSMMAALSIIPLLVAGGAAVDWERAVNTKTGLTMSLDETALYAATLPDTTNAALTSKSQIYLTSNWPATGGATQVDFNVVNNGPSVTATSHARIPNYFMSLVGIPTTTILATSTVVKSGINLEVSMVLDNTGSMGSINPKTGNAAISDLKAAAVKFVNMVMPVTQGQFYTKIAAIPYNNSVNLGSETLAAPTRGPILSGSNNAPGWQIYNFTSYTGQGQSYPATTCVTERQGINSYKDSAFGPGNYAGSFYGPPAYNGCNATPIQPLTTSATALTSTINAMSSGGSTGGQNGIAWGWFTLSRNVGIWSGASNPAPYSVVVSSPQYDSTTPYNSRTRKVMILMTDAEYNSAYCNGVISAPSSISGSGSQQYQIGCASTLGNSYVQSAAMCSAIKQSGVEVYVITFQLDKTVPQRVALTQNCASDAAHVIDADTTSLDAAFAKIANSINNMRISQ